MATAKRKSAAATTAGVAATAATAATTTTTTTTGGGKARAPRRDPLASLKMADIMITKPTFPASIIEIIVDYLEVPDLIRFARVSRRMNEMVYDDARWQKRLRKMGCWNETEARQKLEAEFAMSSGSGSLNSPMSAKRTPILHQTIINGKGRPESQANGDADSSTRARKQNQSASAAKSPSTPSDGFQVASFGKTPPTSMVQKDAALTALKDVRSVRGRARQEYGKVYKALAPFYIDVVKNPTTSALIFTTYSSPEDQALVLSQVQKFSRSDFSPGSEQRESDIGVLVDQVDSAALLEFRKGYEYRDIQGRMRRYAHVIHTLSHDNANDGSVENSSVSLFLNDNQLIAQKGKLGSASDCVDYSLGYGQLSLERVQTFFERLGDMYAQESAIVQAAFPEPQRVLVLLLERVADEILGPFLTALFEDARMRSAQTFLRTFSGAFAGTQQFIKHYALPTGADDSTKQRSNEVMNKIYESHIESYLEEELGIFKQKADQEITQWDQALSEQDASVETFFMANFNRQAVKKDFMSSFKKVVMAPVNILPIMGSNNSATKSKQTANREKVLTGDTPLASRSHSPAPAVTRSATPSLPAVAPTDELAAKAALMETKLENIKSLFSIEVALNLVHAAKSSLERAAQFISLGGQVGEKARQQCAEIYITLMATVGNRHVKVGFDKALDRLSAYNPREGSSSKAGDSSTPTVVPLTTFLELVNVGDLIQQMLDVFFESELITYGISKRDEFVDAPVKAKKAFEAMLDERVAAGLGKGIDVLMDEVEYICATEQQPSDYNPALFDATSTAATLTTLTSDMPAPATSAFSNILGSSSRAATPNPAPTTTTSIIPPSPAPHTPSISTPIPDIDLSPTPTTLKTISLLKSHYSLLIGGTDKTLLDVFASELTSRLFTTVIKRIKRQRISPLGAMRLLSDLSAYNHFIGETFRNRESMVLFGALTEVAQLYLIEGKTDREIDEICDLAKDGERFKGVFGVEEVVEFLERRTDWIAIRARVGRKVSGEGCLVM